MSGWRELEAELEDLRSWRNANQPKAFDVADYIHGKLTRDSVPVDVVAAVAQLFWPEFSRLEGELVLSFRVEKFHELRAADFSPKDAALSANCLCVDGFLPGALMSTTDKLASLLEAAWSTKLRVECPDESRTVKLSRDEESGEILISITALT